MSLLVRRPGLPPLMMAGDVTCDADPAEAGHVPGAGSRRRLREATAGINTMRQLPGHSSKGCGIQVRAPAADKGAIAMDEHLYDIVASKIVTPTLPGATGSAADVIGRDVDDLRVARPGERA